MDKEEKKQAKRDRTIKEIEEVLVKYYKESSSLHVGELLDMKDKLVCHAWRLGEFAADLKLEYSVSYFKRKITINRSMQGFVNGGMTKAQAQIEADSANEELIERETLDEAAAYKADILLKQTNKIIEAIQQRVSYLKAEQPFQGSP